MFGPSFSAVVLPQKPGLLFAEPAFNRFPAMSRHLTSYVYINTGVAARYRMGIIWHDSQSNEVVFQCAGKATPWHGEMQVTSARATMLVRFDACHDSNREPNLKSVLLLATAPETYEGFDYRARFVQMYPMQQWTWESSMASWARAAEWSSDTREWIQVVDAGPPPFTPAA